MKNRITSILLTICMVIALLPSAALAASVPADECAAGGDCAHVAAVGDTHYDTLEEAIAAVAEAEDKNITLLKTAEITQDLDGNGAVLTYAGSSSYGGAAVYALTVSGSVTISNLTLKPTGAYARVFGWHASDESVLTLDGVTLVSRVNELSLPQYAVLAFDEASTDSYTLKLVNGTVLEGWNTVNNCGAGTLNVEMEEGTKVIGINPDSNTDHYWNSSFAFSYTRSSVATAAINVTGEGTVEFAGPYVDVTLAWNGSSEVNNTSVATSVNIPPVHGKNSGADASVVRNGMRRYFYGLDAAVESLQDGDTLELREYKPTPDYFASEEIQLDNNVTLDLAGCSVAAVIPAAGTTVSVINSGSAAANVGEAPIQPGTSVVMTADEEGTVTNVTALSLDKSSVSIDMGRSTTLTATTVPEAAGVPVQWSSSDESVATVDAEGKVTGVKPGSAVITAAIPGSTISADCSVTVNSIRYVSSSGSSSATTYTVKVSSGSNGTVKASHNIASKNATVTVTVTPNSGYELDELTATDKSGNNISLSNSGDGKYTFTMPASAVTVTATFVSVAGDEPVDPVDPVEPVDPADPVDPVIPDDTASGNPFVDVAQGDYFYDAVEWAVENGVTNGVTATSFEPNTVCNRAQMVTFLWRAAGSPQATTTDCAFTDVDMNSYYAKAVLWAVENGIANGTSATTFSPNAECSRAQAVTFMYRMADGAAVGSAGSFADVAADAYYAEAVQWAVENGITNGTGNSTFSPDADCTRAQIVTFLYRYFVK